jgi:glycine/D-amino acid oxidase-like deaminating enzyme
MSVVQRQGSRIAVVGAGIAGLCTAVQIQQALQQSPVSAGAHITIIADKFNTDTTSDGAAGIFRPTADLVGGVPRQLLKQWCEDSFRYYDALAKSKDADAAGVGILSGYHFFIDQPSEKDPLYSEIVYSYRQCRGNEFQLFPHTQSAHHAVNFTTVIVECRWFLPWLMDRFKSNGGRVEMRKVNSLQELAGSFDVVVNCTGLGSIELLNDNLMEPSRGQMLRVRAPWIKHSVYVDHDCWIIPGKETITIGGTRQTGDTDLRLRVQDREKVWSKACKFVPSLEHAKIEWEWVGLRPVRSPLRLETEIMKFGNDSLPVIHNYGHGGNGIALGWGTGKHACQLVLDVLASDRHHATQSRL